MDHGRLRWAGRLTVRVDTLVLFVVSLTVFTTSLKIAITQNHIKFNSLRQAGYSIFLAGQIGFRPCVCSIKAVPAVIPHRVECGFDARIHRACRGCGVRNHVVGTVGLWDSNLIFFMFVNFTALDVNNKFLYMGFVINSIMSGIRYPSHSRTTNENYHLFHDEHPLLPCLNRHVETPPRPALPNCHHSSLFAWK